MKLEQCKRILRSYFNDTGEHNYDVGIYKEHGEYCILYHYEAESINRDAEYVCAR